MTNASSNAAAWATSLCCSHTSCQYDRSWFFAHNNSATALALPVSSKQDRKR